MVRRSVRSIAGDVSQREFQLVGEPDVRLDRIGEGEVIHGGQFVDLREGDWLEVELEVAVSGRGEGARGLLTHVLKQRDPPAPYVAKIPLAAGETLRLRYTFAPEGRAEEVQCHSMGELLAGESLEFHFRKARMTLHRSGDRPAAGVQVELLEVEPAS